jgi:hypothetical protein
MKITEKQKLPVTRQSERVQEQMLRKYGMSSHEETRKRSLQGTNLSSHNSFVALENAEIVGIAGGMGVNILSGQFELVDLVKDLELARHAIHPPLDEENVQISEIVAGDSCLALKWPVDNSESKSFTLVESRKKKREKKRSKNLTKDAPIRRSKRTTPSLYRRDGSQKISGSPN